jgi:hypothetical protein
MGHVSDPAFLVAHALKLKGFAEPDVVAEITGMDVGDVQAHLEKLKSGELACYREGRISGWMLTPAGRERHAELLTADIEAAGTRDAIMEFYEPYRSVNAELKQVCTAWQLKDETTPNDHADAVYDRSVIAKLRTVNDRIQPLCVDLTALLPRLAPYGPRLDACVVAIEAGDHDRMTKPLNNSYHDIWMEMHEDLIATLGLKRTASDA